MNNERKKIYDVRRKITQMIRKKKLLESKRRKRRRENDVNEEENLKNEATGKNKAK